MQCHQPGIMLPPDVPSFLLGVFLQRWMSSIGHFIHTPDSAFLKTFRMITMIYYASSPSSTLFLVDDTQNQGFLCVYVTHGVLFEPLVIQLTTRRIGGCRSCSQCAECE